MVTGCPAGGGTFLYDRDVFCSGQAWNSNDPFGWHYISRPIAGFGTDNIPDYFVNAWNELLQVLILISHGCIMVMILIQLHVHLSKCPNGPTGCWSVNFDPAYPYDVLV